MHGSGKLLSSGRLGGEVGIPALSTCFKCQAHKPGKLLSFGRLGGEVGIPVLSAGHVTQATCLPALSARHIIQISCLPALSARACFKCHVLNATHEIQASCLFSVGPVATSGDLATARSPPLAISGRYFRAHSARVSDPGVI
jgi:hypothetical protein